MQRLRLWGSQVELTAIALALSWLSPICYSTHAWDPEAFSKDSTALSESTMFMLSSSEGVDIVSIKAGDIEDSPPVSPAYEELVEVVTRAVTKLNIKRPAEKQEVCHKNKL